MKFSALLKYFTLTEKILWSSSVLLTLATYIIFNQSDALSLAASLIGVTALIFNAKGNPIGPALMIIFSLIYGIISYSFAYYGEMLTYLGMSGPMATFALISWLKNPFGQSKTQVAINKIAKKEMGFIAFASITATIIFYYILKYLGTANLWPSTFSVTTSFAAAYLSFRRSPYFAIIYAVNDLVLILLWSLASIQDTSYISVIICFIVFLANDLYSFINWRRMERQQQTAHKKYVSDHIANDEKR